MSPDSPNPQQPKLCRAIFPVAGELRREQARAKQQLRQGWRQLDLVPYEPVKPAEPARRLFQITFDGGCKFEKGVSGVGVGYGSYRIDEREIVRLSFGNNMTANAAEALTLARALEELSALVVAADSAVLIVGDSRVALFSALRLRNPSARPRAKVHESFVSACELLAQSVRRFGKIDTRWQPRKKSVAVFGH